MTKTLSNIDNQLGEISSKTEKANLVGTLIAERAKAVGIKKCSFDRNGYLYHGQLKIDCAHQKLTRANTEIESFSQDQG